MTLDRDAAVSALAPLAGRLGFDEADSACRVAEAALRVATAKMAAEVRKICAARGVDPREYIAVGYGGAGPTHVNMLANELGITKILIPGSPGTFCAMGAIMTDLKRDYVRTIRTRISAATFAQSLAHSAAEIRSEADAWLAAEGLSGNAGETNWIADMRYGGEAQGMVIPLSADMVDTADVQGIAEAFHADHERSYGFREDHNPVEMLSLRARIIAKVPRIGDLKLAEGPPRPPREKRRIFAAGRWCEAQVFNRSDLVPHQSFQGPALIEQEDTTVWILEGWRASVDPHGLVTLESASHGN
jgi:N-methylhydantoinase A